VNTPLNLRQVFTRTKKKHEANAKSKLTHFGVFFLFKKSTFNLQRGWERFYLFKRISCNKMFRCWNVAKKSSSISPKRNVYAVDFSAEPIKRNFHEQTKIRRWKMQTS